MKPEGINVAVVGAGQAGLAVAYFLRQAGLELTVLERADSIGSAWRERWESLTLFTPRRFDTLPGLPFPGDPEGYPDKDEVADYLDLYGKALDLPVRLRTRVSSVARDGSGGFVVEAGGTTLEARQV